ncbi:MAG TPA: NADH-quinone oxidoreductase subunit M [Thermoplasmata archaeon]|nr:NADH-quinone oxidoreductase subunit M [Thermoplasmata archaeon]
MLPWISIVLGTLLAGTVLTFASGRYARWVALATSAVFLLEVSALLLVYPGWPGYANGIPGFALSESHPWIHLGWLQVNYTVGVDGISLVLILLTAILQIATVVYSWGEEKRPAAYFGLVLLTCLGCAGVFVALDILLFFLFWEAVLVPMFFLIGFWGGPRRRYAALKFFVYTHVASISMLVGLLALAFYSGATSFDFSAVYAAAPSLSPVVQSFLFLALFFGFGVKFPIVPFHTWLPDAHVEAPTGGSVLLAGLLLKLGGYGLIRWAVEILGSPGRVGLHNVQPILFFVAFLSIAWGSIVSLSQRDLKRLVAYSSINHMGIVLLAIALDSSLGLLAAVLLMFAHGVVSGLMFMTAGTVHHTFGSRDIPSIGGITPTTPALSTMIMVGSLASLGLPALISFPAEFAALLATWDGLTYWVFIPLIILVVTAAFYLWMMQRMLFGPPKGVPLETQDVNWYEGAGMGLLVAMTVLFGILPGLLVNVITSSPVKGFPGGP